MPIKSPHQITVRGCNRHQGQNSEQAAPGSPGLDSHDKTSSTNPDTGGQGSMNALSSFQRSDATSKGSLNVSAGSNMNHYDVTLSLDMSRDIGSLEKTSSTNPDTGGQGSMNAPSSFQRSDAASKGSLNASVGSNMDHYDATLSLDMSRHIGILEKTSSTNPDTGGQESMNAPSSFQRSDAASKGSLNASVGSNMNHYGATLSLDMSRHIGSLEKTSSTNPDTGGQESMNTPSSFQRTDATSKGSLNASAGSNTNPYDAALSLDISKHSDSLNTTFTVSTLCSDRNVNKQIMLSRREFSENPTSYTHGDQLPGELKKEGKELVHDDGQGNDGVQSSVRPVTETSDKSDTVEGSVLPRMELLHEMSPSLPTPLHSKKNVDGSQLTHRTAVSEPVVVYVPGDSEFKKIVRPSSDVVRKGEAELSQRRPTMGICDTCREQSPFGTQRDYVTAIERPVSQEIGIRERWGLYHPPPVPFTAVKPHEGQTRADQISPLKGQIISEFIPEYPGRELTELQHGLSELVGDEGPVALESGLFPQLPDGQLAQPNLYDTYDDTVFPTGHRLGTSEGLQAAMDKVRLEERRRTYRKPVLPPHGYTKPLGSFVACHNKFPHSTKGDLFVKYRHLASQINRRLYDEWEAEALARAAIEQFLPVPEGAASENMSMSVVDNLGSGEDAYSLQQQLANAYGMPRVGPERKRPDSGQFRPDSDLSRSESGRFRPSRPLRSRVIIDTKPSVNPYQLLSTLPAIPSEVKLSGGGSTGSSLKQGDHGSSNSLASRSLKEPKDKVSQTSLSLSKTWPIAGDILKIPRQGKAIKVTEHPPQCICTACSKAANWVNTFGSTCFADQQMPPLDKETMVIFPGKDEAPGGDVRATIESNFPQQERESPKLVKVRQVDVRSWEIEKLENMLNPKSLEEKRNKETKPSRKIRASGSGHRKL